MGRSVGGEPSIVYKLRRGLASTVKGARRTATLSRQQRAILQNSEVSARLTWGASAYQQAAYPGTGRQRAMHLARRSNGRAAQRACPRGTPRRATRACYVGWQRGRRRIATRRPCLDRANPSPRQGSLLWRDKYANGGGSPTRSVRLGRLSSCGIVAAVRIPRMPNRGRSLPRHL